MKGFESTELARQNATLMRGWVIGSEGHRPIVGRLEDEIDDGHVCDVLLSSNGVAPLEVGEEVLIWQPSTAGERGVILGRVAAGKVGSSPSTPEKAPEELVLEAQKNLTLKCGEGSITIREDGKILIKGKDLVSHAQRMNRIKGGSVSIN